jgi:hypothetical protein
LRNYSTSRASDHHSLVASNSYLSLLRNHHPVTSLYSRCLASPTPRLRLRAPSVQRASSHNISHRPSSHNTITPQLLPLYTVSLPPPVLSPMPLPSLPAAPPIPIRRRPTATTPPNIASPNIPPHPTTPLVLHTEPTPTILPKDTCRLTIFDATMTRTGVTTRLTSGSRTRKNVRICFRFLKPVQTRLGWWKALGICILGDKMSCQGLAYCVLDTEMVSYTLCISACSTVTLTPLYTSYNTIHLYIRRFKLRRCGPPLIVAHHPFVKPIESIVFGNIVDSELITTLDTTFLRIPGLLSRTRFREVQCEPTRSINKT